MSVPRYSMILLGSFIACISLCKFSGAYPIQATFCRVCDSHDLTARDNCHQTSHKQHVVCGDNRSCLTQYSMTSSGLRIQKSCADDAVCLSEWWLESHNNPNCTEHSLTDAFVGITDPWDLHCSVCCHAIDSSNPYCSENFYPPEATLVLYPQVTTPSSLGEDEGYEDELNTTSTQSTNSSSAFEQDGEATEEPEVSQTATSQCYQCGSLSSSEPCDPMTSSRDMEVCPAGLQFCMNDVYYNSSAKTTSVYKRCVSEDECRDKWFNQSSDIDECIAFGQYDPDQIFFKDQWCHFCCTESGCNQADRPEDDQLWMPF